MQLVPFNWNHSNEMQLLTAIRKGKYLKFTNAYQLIKLVTPGREIGRTLRTSAKDEMPESPDHD